MPPESDAVVESAIWWRWQLDHSRDTEDTRRAIEQWCAEAPAHRRAWQRLQEMDGDFEHIARVLPGQGAAVLDRASADLQRRQVLKMALGAGVVASMPGLWWGLSESRFAADYRAGISERREIRLVDGTRVILNTRSAIDVAMQERRRLKLLDGEIHVEAGGNTGLFRDMPLEVGFHHGSCMAAPRTRFNLRENQGSSELSVESGWLEARSGEQRRYLSGGDNVTLTEGRIHTLDALDVAPGAWVQGKLVVTNIALGDFVRELARYRHGRIACDPAVADLRLSGVFQLAAQDDILEHLSRLLPIEVVSRTRWWISIVPRAIA